MGKDDHRADKALCLANTFQLMLGAAKASLFPFLTIYFRMLGLSATQTSLIFGAKAFMSLVCAPTWTVCAKRFNKKKLVLVFSMFMMLASSLLLALIPPADENVQLAYCSHGVKNGSVDIFPNKIFGEANNQSVVETSLGNKSLASNVSLTEAPTRPLVMTAETQSTTRSPPPTTQTTMVTTKTSSASPSTTLVAMQQPHQSSNADTSDRFEDTALKDEHHSSDSDEKEAYDKAIFLSQLTPEDFEMLRSVGIDRDALERLTTKVLEEKFLSILGENEPEENEHVPEDKKRVKRNPIQRFRSKWKELTDSFDLAEYQTFIFVLSLVIIGELFSAPHEKLADDCWFEYLDIIDDLEHYGQHWIWRTVGFVLLPTIVTAIVDHTDCLLPFGVHHFTIHFFTFAGFAFIAFMLVFCYPVSQRKQTSKKSRFVKGVKMLCSDVHAVSLSISMMMVGAASAVISNFLFWKLQDLGSTEIVWGTAVAASAGSEFVMLLVGKGLVKKLRVVGAVALGLLLLAGRLLLYSFLWTPWLAIAGEVFQGFSVTMVWIALQTYPDFRINPYIMDRSAFTVLNVLQYGVGFGGASMVAGLVYDKFGYAVLNQSMSVAIIVWAAIFFIIQKTVRRKEKVRYAKLLQDENAYDSDESAVFEDDWLEVAMKRER